MTEHSRRDAGQAFPIYIVMVAGLLFLAFAFFAVGQASATRNGAQGAADAAALAAAQEARDGLGVQLLPVLREPNGLNEFLATHEYFQAGRGKATQLAFDNRSDLIDFGWRTGYWQDKVTARIKTHYTVGESVIPGTEKTHATATATAVIKFRCSTKVQGLPDPADDEDEGDGGNDGDDKSGTPDLPILTLDCDGVEVPLDLGDHDLAAGLGKLLFDVQLIDD
ncbi:pilus assembly protein TadG-related protein [Streptomyces sp. OR43]|uniref:pilus assembly protein TadG-related protein n=1 Tax=Streptomyces sp. or43 TaxID=2478957 RepID=UPI0011CE648F|nr:pilus assembly protein TadG-related protein [Streptomyces sp. or43]TXS37767.1 hypothetical protein EAO72_31365 [Streptomyces sp. or43]